jgi:hypothetical protein
MTSVTELSIAHRLLSRWMAHGKITDVLPRDLAWSGYRNKVIDGGGGYSFC